MLVVGCRSNCSMAVKTQRGQGNSNWGLAYSFRVLVRDHHGGEHDIDKMSLEQ